MSEKEGRNPRAITKDDVMSRGWEVDDIFVRHWIRKMTDKEWADLKRHEEERRESSRQADGGK